MGSTSTMTRVGRDLVFGYVGLELSEQTMQRFPGGGFDQQLMAVGPVDLFQRRGGRPQDTHGSGPDAVEEIADLTRKAGRSLPASLQDHDTGENCIRRIEHRPAELDLAFVELFEPLC